MENEIKVNDYVRLKDGTIVKVIEIKNQNTDILNWYCLDNDMGTMDRSIVKHSPKLIDLIECGDYVNGYIVRRTYLDGAIHYIKLGEQITGNRTYNDDIKTVVTREQFESISYKVKE